MKLKLSFYEFLGSRLGLPGTQIPHLAELIRPAPVLTPRSRPEICPGYCANHLTHWYQATICGAREATLSHFGVE